MGFRGSRVQIPPSRLGPRRRRGGLVVTARLAPPLAPLAAFPLKSRRPDWVKSKTCSDSCCGACFPPAGAETRVQPLGLISARNRGLLHSGARSGYACPSQLVVLFGNARSPIPSDNTLRARSRSPIR